MEEMTNTSYNASSPPEQGEKKGMDADGFKSTNGQLLHEEDSYKATTTTNTVDDDSMEEDVDESSDSKESSYSNLNNDDEVSVISDDTDIRNLDSQHAAAARRTKFNRIKKTKSSSSNKKLNKNKLKKENSSGTSPMSPSYYQVKEKDSMEEEMSIDVTNNGGRKTTDLSKNSKKSKEEKKSINKQRGYTDIKKNDSMEKDMSIDYSNENGGGNKVMMMDEDRHVVGGHHDHRSVISPPNVQRRPFTFDDHPEDEFEVTNVGRKGRRYNTSVPEYKDDMVVGRSYQQQSPRSVSDYPSSDYDEDDESEASDDPTVFPSKAISQMNLGHSNNDTNDTNNESEDRVERACYHLSRGRNDEALHVLTEALNIAQTNVTNAKARMDYYYFEKKRKKTTKGRPNNYNNEDEMMMMNEDDEETEETLDTDLRNCASQMANILNNIGVVYEMKEEYQRAMNSFRDALDVYRNQCHRYENADDPDVDRTVHNIMQMGIAMRSHDKRMDLHNEEAELADQTVRWQKQSDNQGLCTQLRMARLNLLMCVLDIETEGLGLDHPAVGFTLLKKGALHLEMMHVDMAIKDTQDALSILKKGLGNIHPEVGYACIRLGDIFNYNLGRYKSGHKDVALSYYKEALTPLRESFGKVNPHSGLAYNGIGILYASRGDTKRALSSFYNALASFGVRTRADNEANSGHLHSSRPDVFFVWINVGGLHMMKHEWELSLRSYLKAHSAFSCLDEDDKSRLQKIGPRRLMANALALSPRQSSFGDNDTLIASVLEKIGKAQSMLHKYGQAIETLEEALRIHQVVAMRTTGSKKGAKEASSSSQDVARILENLGEVQMISGDLTSAFSSYVKSLNLLRANKQVDDASIEVALVLGAIGKVHLKKGEYSEAKVVLKESMRSFEKIGVPPNNRRINEIRSCLVDSELALIQTATTTLAGQRREISSIPYVDKALAIDEIADAYRNKMDYSGAIWFYSEALVIRRRRAEQRLSSSGRRDSSELVDIGRTISNIAQLRRDRREFGAAKVLFDEVKQLYRSVGLSTSHPFYRDLSMEIEVMRKM